MPIQSEVMPRRKNPDPDSVSFIGRNLDHYRKVAHLTQEELAAKSGVSRNVIARLVSGAVSNTGVESLQAMADALGVGIGDLTADPDVRVHMGQMWSEFAASPAGEALRISQDDLNELSSWPDSLWSHLKPTHESLGFMVLAFRHARKR